MEKNDLEISMEEDVENYNNKKAAEKFSELVQKDQYVGETYSINYETIKVVISDYFRKQVGGISSLSFLIATRVDPEKEYIDFKREDSSIILLRVLDATDTPESNEKEALRHEIARRVSGENKFWDSEDAMDHKTREFLASSALECRIIGTFYLEEALKEAKGKLQLKFGCDISNFYPNKGLKVYKPNGEALEKIINYIDPETLKEHYEEYENNSKVRLGNVRYASTRRKHQKIDNVPVYMYPTDLLTQKTALFGMTRTGKSNTTKIIAKSVYELRYPDSEEGEPLRIGQLIFDPNGEYANETVQDRGSLKRVWKLKEDAKREDEVVTYGLDDHPDDPHRKHMRINFFKQELLQQGKDIINNILEDEGAQYIRNFVNVRFEKPNKNDYEDDEFWSYLVRYRRRVLVYQTLLKKAGFNEGYFKPKLKVGKTPFFNSDILEIMSNVELNNTKKQNLINSAAETLSKENPSWGALASAFEGLFYFISDTEAYIDYNQDYIKESTTGEGWADSDLERLLEMFVYSKGANLIGKAEDYHSFGMDEDYAEEIYNDLVEGKLVIVDQATGDPEINKNVSKKIMWKIFRENQNKFRLGNKPDHILVYLEEAHNLLPAGTETDMQDIWVRTAKEGAKYNIGMIYATQEVSSIQKNILKNTANWFISHLNNTDETKELCKYYDFEDFERSIRRAQDKGFLRVKTLSSFFVKPIQVDLFEIEEGE